MSHGVVKPKAEKDGARADGGAGGGRQVAEVPLPPDGGWGWVVVFASFMIHIVTDGMTYSFGVFYDEFLLYFGEGKAYTAWIVSILVGVTLCSGPISSSFVNRFGCRAVTIAGAMLAAVSVIISAYAQNVLTLIFTIGIGTGLGFGLIYLPAIVSVTVWFEKYRSLATGIAVCGSGFGTFIFAPLTNYLIKEYGWNGAMFIIGGLVLNCIAFGIMFRPVPEVPVGSSTEPMLPKSPNTPLKRSQSTEHVVSANGRVNGTNGDAWRLTLSQPALNGPHEMRSRSGSGVMQRPDVLYQGSMASLSKHRSPSPLPLQHMMEHDQSQEHHLSMEYHERHDDEEKNCWWLPCAAESKAALSEMLDLSLLVDPVFILFSLSNFLTSIGFYIPYVYIVVHARSMGIDSTWASYCLSVIGIANSIGRLVLGYISDKPWINRLYVYNTCLTVCGISTAMAMLFWEFWGLALYSTVFGFTIGAYVGLTSVVLVDLLGINRLTNAFGLLLLFQGLASLLGPPFAGWLYDELKSYKPGFYVAGGTIALSGLILFLIPLVQSRQNNKAWAKDVVLEEI